MKGLLRKLVFGQVGKMVVISVISGFGLSLRGTGREDDLRRLLDEQGASWDRQDGVNRVRLRASESKDKTGV